MTLIYRLFLAVILATGLGLTACTVNEDDDPDTTIVAPADEPDVNINPPDINIDAPKDAPDVEVDVDD